MNKRQKLVQAQFLNNEEAVIRRLKQVYNQAQKDIEKKTQALQDEINRLGTLAKLSVDDEEKAQLLSMQQSKIYQKQYQDAMKKQIGSVLDNMQVEEFKTVSEYLQKCYEDGFVGTMFDLQGQGIPLCFPMDQEAMVRAVQLDSKISQGLYSRLGEDVAMLKKKITAQVSRGIATGMTFQQVAQQLAGYTNIGFNNAVRISRTEGHRIQVQSAMDACHKAKEKGADVVKQWDAALDSRTRESHQMVDGEIRELDKPFSNGLMFPGDPSGGAAEVVNCRCALLQRAKWALDEDELETLKERAEYFGLDKADTFDEYKEKYLSGTKQIQKIDDFVADVAEKHGIKIDISAAGGLIDEAKAQIEAVDELLTQYNSTMVDYRLVKGGFYDKDGGQCYMLGGKSAVSVKTSTIKRNSSQDRLNLGDNCHLMTTYHEFAHSLSQYREGMDADFWKDIKKVRTSYRKSLKDIDKAEIVDKTMDTAEAMAARKKIFISDYAEKDIDEFLADAFAQAKLSGNPSPYAKEVLSVVDKYFKKSGIADDIAEEVVEKSVKSAKMFVPATDKAEAIKYAKRFNVDADYSKYNLDVANSINETMAKIEDTFGSKALDQLHKIGTFPQGYSTRYAGAYVRAGDHDLDGSLWLRNVSRKNSLEKLESVAKEQYDAGYWSTPEALHTIRHELGHAIHRAIETPEINAQLTELRKSIVDERMNRHRRGDHNHKYSDWLSEYGMTNTKEFVAESVAEYLAGNPRETAAKVVEILMGGK